MSETIEVFISYSKQDKELRDGLLAHLDVLRGEGIITWHDRQILPGTEWDEEIKARLNAADIILLLISAAFLNTDYCKQVEIPEALRRHTAGEATVMPVILRSCGWKYTPLSAIQAYPEKAKPIVTWTYIDDAYTDVVDAVYQAATQIKERRDQQRQAAELERWRQFEQFAQLRQRQAEAARLEQEEQERQRQAQREQEAEKQRQQALVQQNRSINTDGLISDRHIDYTRLRDLLKAGKWKEADRENYRLMITTVGKEEGQWFDREDLLNFPYEALKMIDRLWVHYSKEKFGFSVQKRIWRECGSPTEYSMNWIKFGDCVGWRKEGKWLDYNSLAFDLKKSFLGELPCDWLDWADLKRGYHGLILLAREDL